jgi:sugar lactone lactonase YvrE
MAWLLLLGGALLLSGCDEPPELEETPATPDGGGTGGGGVVLTVSTFAGSGEHSYADGTGAEAKFSQPFGVAVDGDGKVYVGDMSNFRIRMITPGGTVTTLAGSTQGYAEGSGTAAKFSSPRGVAVDSAGTVYVADSWNHRIRRITLGGEVTTLAGGSGGYAEGTGTAAQFDNPQSVALDGEGNVYVADLRNHRIRKITPGGVVTTLAGSTQGRADGIGAAAKFYNPAGVAVDSAGTVYVADSRNHRIRKITITQGEGGGDVVTVTTLAGSGEGVGPYKGGYADGPGTEAKFNNPTGVAVDSAGTIYVADMGNYCIRKITPDGTVSTLAGTGAQGYAEGAGAVAQFGAPYGVAVNSKGTVVYVADTYNSRIRKIAPQ